MIRPQGSGIALLVDVVVHGISLLVGLPWFEPIVDGDSIRHEFRKEVDRLPLLSVEGVDYRSQDVDVRLYVEKHPSEEK